MKYYLTKSNLSPQGNKYKAYIKTTGTCTKEELIERILDKGTLLTKTDVLAALNALDEVIIQLLSEGKNINLPLFNIGYSVSGDFDNQADTFDRNRHKLNVNINRGVLLRDVSKKITLSKTDYKPTLPKILQVKDALSQTINSQLTPNGITEIHGANIKIDGTDTQCGVFFINSNGETTKASVIARNTPSCIILQTPQLPQGEYSIKIITQYTKQRLQKLPLSTTFSKTLVVY